MKIERELGTQEIKTLDKLQREIQKEKKRLARFFLLWIILCFSVGVCIGVFLNPDLWILLGGTVLVFIVIGFWVYLQERSKENKELKQIEFLRVKNRVTSVTVQTREFYELTEEEDEGVYYLFQISPDKILTFGGQDYYSRKKFPNSDFEIVEGKGGDGEIVLFEIYCRGEKIKPLKRIKGKQKWDFLERINQDDFHVIEGRLEQLA